MRKFKIGESFISYLRLVLTCRFIFFSFLCFFFPNGDDVIGAFQHENNITASSIHKRMLIFSTPSPFFLIFFLVLFCFCFCAVVFCFVLFFFF